MHMSSQHLCFLSSLPLHLQFVSAHHYAPPQRTSRQNGLSAPSRAHALGFSRPASLVLAAIRALHHPYNSSASRRFRRPTTHPACAILWLRVGELRLADNPAVHAAGVCAPSTPLLPVLTLNPVDAANPRVLQAAFALRRRLASLGSVLVVRVLPHLAAEADAVLRLTALVGANVVYVNTSPASQLLRARALALRLAPHSAGARSAVFAGAGSHVRVIACAGIGTLMLSPPARMPCTPAGAYVLCMECDALLRAVAERGEIAALQRLEWVVSMMSQMSYAAVAGILRTELELGCVSRQRVRRRVAEKGARHAPWGRAWQGRGFGPVLTAVPGSAGLLAIAAYDVNGGDRRGIAWDEAAGEFRLKEWEHAELERRMNPKERGTEFVRRRKMFLTRAFIPDDVTPDYYLFTAWRFAQRCVSATVGVLGTQALLVALGVKAGRIGQAAAISWVLKDGFGRVGKMLWASGMGKDFDVDPKRWRFRSALLYAVGNGLEIVTQIFPASFLVVATLANSMKQVSMLTSSATRNAMYRSFGGKAQNIANITAKGEAQIVLADLIGMGCGIQLSKAIGSSKAHVLGAYLSLTAADLVGIYMELRSVVFRTLNAERSSLVIEHYIRTGKVISPAEVSDKERILLKPRYRSRSRFSSVVKAANDPAELDLLLKVFGKEKFIVSLPEKPSLSSPCRVVLRKDARSFDVLRALLTVGYVLDDTRGERLSKMKSWSRSDKNAEAHLRYARRAANKDFPSFLAVVREAGWNVDHLLFGTVKRGAFWGTPTRSP